MSFWVTGLRRWPCQPTASIIRTFAENPCSTAQAPYARNRNGESRQNVTGKPASEL